MPAADERRFIKALKARNFERVYYFYGDEELLKEQGLRNLIDAAVDPATRDFNLDVRAAASLDGEALASLVGTPPMMAERRMVVVRDASALKKEARKALDSYLAVASPDVLLVLVEPGGERGKPDKALASLPGGIEFQPLSEDRLPRWIAHHTQSVLGTTISDEATELLIAAVGNDLPALASELDKAASFAAGAQIDESAISAVVGIRRGETMGDLLTRIAKRDIPGALSILGPVLEHPKAGGVPIVMALTVHVLAIGYAQDALARGLPKARLYTELFDLLKSGGGLLVGMPWGEAVKQWSGSVSVWSPRSVDRALAALLAADLALKESRVSTDEQILTSLILEMCASDAQHDPHAERPNG